MNTHIETLAEAGKFDNTDLGVIKEIMKRVTLKFIAETYGI